MANEISVDNIINASTALLAQSQQQTNQIIETQNARVAASSEAADLALESARKTALVTSVADQAKLKTQQENLTLAQSAGISGNDEILTGLLADMRAATVGYKAAAEKVHGLERNNNLLANPMGWLTDLLIGDEARDDRDFLLEKQQDTAAMIQNLNAAVSQSAQTKILTTQTLTAESLADKAAASEALATAENMAAKVDAMGYSVEAIRAAKQQTMETYRMGVDLYNMGVQAEMHNFARERFEEEKKIRAKALEDAEDDDSALEQTTASINVYFKNLGLAPTTKEDVDRNYKLNSPYGDTLRNAHAFGEATRRKGSLTLGVNPGQAAMLTYQATGSFDAFSKLPDPHIKQAVERNVALMREDRARLLSANTQAERDALIPKLQSGINEDSIKHPELQNEILNNLILRDLSTKERDFPDQPSNLSFAASEFPEMKTSAFWTTVIEPLAEAGVNIDDLTTNDLARKFASAYTSGDVTEPQAVRSMEVIMQRIFDHYNNNSGRIAINAPFIKPRTVETNEGIGNVWGTVLLSSPIAAIATGTAANFFDTDLKTIIKGKGDTSFDLTNSADISQYLARYKAQEFKSQLDKGQ